MERSEKDSKLIVAVVVFSELKVVLIPPNHTRIAIIVIIIISIIITTVDRSSQDLQAGSSNWQQCHLVTICILLSIMI